ncbi:MAG TPA: hypothetical protein VIJ72_06480, partial [Rhizomicrobium sp.]
NKSAPPEKYRPERIAVARGWTMIARLAAWPPEMIARRHTPSLLQRRIAWTDPSNLSFTT